MRLRTKVVLLAVLPLLASLLLIALAIGVQEAQLARREHARVESAYLDARRTELRNYVHLALSTLKPLYDDTADAPARRRDALRLLGSLDYGADGYFFVYDLSGTVLMHSRQPELVGRNLWDLRDAAGHATIQELIARAKAGGGFVTYQWRKPSNGQTVPKMGYVIALDRWQWMVGTGLYLDDIQQTLAHLDEQARQNIASTLLWVASIAALGVGIISAAALTLNLSESRVADAKLRLMAREVVQSQEDERARLARELHDGTGQTLVSTKLMIESAVENLQAGRSATPPLASALLRLNDALAEVRGISHRLRPALLDTLGLPAALAHLAAEIGEAGRLNVGAQTQGPVQPLPDVVNTVLFRVAQEALTNAVKHARASNVEITLAFEAGVAVKLVVADDGVGFDVESVQRHPRQGLGLRHMRERLVGIGGAIELQSRPGHGTQIEASMPAAALAGLRRQDAGAPATVA